MYGNVVFNPSMGGIGYRGPSGVPGTPVMKTSNVRPGVKFHTPRSAGAQMLPGKMKAAQRSAVASAAASRRGVAAADAAYKRNFSARTAASKTVNNAPGKKGILGALSGMSKRTKVGIGLGLGVAAGVTMNRRGEGASPGRQSIYRY